MQIGSRRRICVPTAAANQMIIFLERRI